MNNSTKLHVVCGCQHIASARDGDLVVPHGAMHQGIATIHGGPQLTRRQHVTEHNVDRPSSETHGAIPTPDTGADGNAGKIKALHDPAAQETRCARHEYSLHGIISLCFVAKPARGLQGGEVGIGVIPGLVKRAGVLIRCVDHCDGRSHVLRREQGPFTSRHDAQEIFDQSPGILMIHGRLSRP